MLKKKIRKILGTPSEAKSKIKLSSLKDGDYLIGDVPYQCQFASPELAGDILDKKVCARDDPNWAVFGFKTREESEYWAWRDCGVCCVKMVLDYHGRHFRMADLVDEGVKLRGYDVDKDIGWFYKPLVELAKKHDVKGYSASYIGMNEVAAQILIKRFVIASVNPSIIRFDKNPATKEKSGHLVLVIGFKFENRRISGFYINNPSGRTSKTQKKSLIPTEVFSRAFGEQGIVLQGSSL